MLIVRLRAQALLLHKQSPALLRESEALYGRALAVAPADARALEGLAVVLWLQASNYSTEFGVSDDALRSQHFQRAAVLARRALAVDAGLIRPHYVLATQALNAGDHESALRTLQRALALDPRRASTLNNLGAVYRDIGELERSLDLLMQANALPSLAPSAATLHNLAMTTMPMGRLDDAVSWARRGLDAVRTTQASTRRSLWHWQCEGTPSSRASRRPRHCAWSRG